jgi:hypothetical protein
MQAEARHTACNARPGNTHLSCMSKIPPGFRYGDFGCMAFVSEWYRSKNNANTVIGIIKTKLKSFNNKTIDILVRYHDTALKAVYFNLT